MIGKTLVLSTIFILGSLTLHAQIQPSKQPNSTSIGKPIRASFGMKKCERYMRNYKRLLKIVITANPSESNPLEITKQVGRAYIVYKQGSKGHIVMDKTFKCVAFPPINQFITSPPIGLYPVTTTSFSFLDTNENGQSNDSSVGIVWEAGNYANVIQVTDVYKIGNQAYADIKRSNGAMESIMIFPEHLMDKCEIPVR